MATPQIPPRPVRTQDLPGHSATMEIPRIPPRPKRNVERSVSPHRYARSPLNDPLFLHNGARSSRENLSPEGIRRPPSVNLPSIGQEGSEYANLSEDTSPPEQTKNVAGDLPLHQPKASVPASTAKSRIQIVTRTDSSQAAAVGIGKLLAESDKGGNISSARSDTSNGTRSRPQSIYKDEEEHGIPEIGLQVPMYPNAGDVQAPTPSQNSLPPATGVGFFNNGGQAAQRQHFRTKSGRQVFAGPPGSYGLHGHGHISQDSLEKSWYDKHPDDAVREMQGEYGPAIQVNRKDYNLSKEDLNKLVHETANRAIGAGANRDFVSTPDEEIGYRASDEYTSRIASPKPRSRPGSIILGGPAKQRSGSSQTHAESPLRQSFFPAHHANSSEQALESEIEDETIHIEPPVPSRPSSSTPLGERDLRRTISDEDGYQTPILASDEVARHPPKEFLQPAVSPEDRRSSNEYIESHLQQRPHSRNNSLNQNQLHRVPSVDNQGRHSAPLEGVKEYEPLFPEDSDEEKRKKPRTQADKLKRPDLARHHFPSQDIWEDTPNSLQLETTVETPELEEQLPQAPPPTDNAKPEAHRKPAEAEENRSFLQEKDNRSKKPFPKHLMAEGAGRPGLGQRFPSQDIWEDAPEHVYQYTTVETPEPEEPTSAVEAKQPEIPARPDIPSRPQRTKPATEVSPVDKKIPTIPDRPKPQVPTRPSKPIKRESSEDVPLTKTVSGGESAAPKAKPAVPARPGGSKIAALKAGFMSDLNAKLGLGPQAPKVKEPEEAAPEVVEEKAPLADARKGRAKGPQRRKPTASPSPAVAAATESKPAPTLTLSFAPLVTVFSISHDGSLSVPAHKEFTKEALRDIEAPITASHQAVQEPVASEQEAPAKAAKTSETAEAAVQTGQQEIKITSPDGSTDQATAFIGGQAPEEGNVVVDKDGVEHVSNASAQKPIKDESVDAAVSTEES